MPPRPAGLLGLRSQHFAPPGVYSSALLKSRFVYPIFMIDIRLPGFMGEKFPCCLTGSRTLVHSFDRDMKHSLLIKICAMLGRGGIGSAFASFGFLVDRDPLLLGLG
jgi:hypothetical protein